MCDRLEWRLLVGSSYGLKQTLSARRAIDGEQAGAAGAHAVARAVSLALVPDGDGIVVGCGLVVHRVVGDVGWS